MAFIAKQRYKLDIAPKGGWVIVYASQHDDGAREIEFEITNQGRAFSIPASINVSVQGIKSNRSYFSHSCSYSGNIVTMALADDMTDIVGKAICVLKFTNSSEQKLATAKFILNVDSDSSSEGIIIDTEAEEIFNQMLNDIRAQASAISVDIAELQSMVGTPLVASTVSAMNDHNKIYVYTGSESGYTSGNWYYWNGSAWTSGGIYNSTAFETDKTLSVENMAADAQVTGKKINVNFDLISQGFKVSRNLFYTDGIWSDAYGAIASLLSSGLVVETKADGLNYTSAQFFLDVTNIDAVTLSFESMVGSGGAVPRIRYGKEDSTGTAWFGFITRTTTIDTSNYYTLKIAFYTHYGVTSVQGSTSTFNGIQLDIGAYATQFIAGAKVDGLNLGTGNTPYLGERLQIGRLSSLYRCDVSIWKNYFNDTEHNLHQNQSIANYGNFIFILLNGGTIHIIDKTTKEIVGTMSLNVSSNHQNSAQFLDGIYAEDGDEFPILIISRCGNSSTSSSNPLPGTDAALMTRIQHVDGVWSITNLGTIALDIPTWGASWAVDTLFNRLINISYQNGTYAITDNNPVVVTVFNIPTKDKYIGHALILRESDIVAKTYIDHFVLQAMYARGDLLYLPAKASGDSSWLYVFSLSKNGIITAVQFESAFEPEGVMMMDNALYISARRGTDSAGINPLKIYEITNN